MGQKNLPGKFACLSLHLQRLARLAILARAQEVGQVWQRVWQVVASVKKDRQICQVSFFAWQDKERHVYKYYDFSLNEELTVGHPNSHADNIVHLVVFHLYTSYSNLVVNLSVN